MMNSYQRYRHMGIVFLAALALTACDPAAPPSSQAVTAPATAMPVPPSALPATALPAPAETPPATELPAPTEAPTEQPPATPWPDALLPTDVPWIRSAAKIFADDETLDFQQRGLSLPEYRLQVSPDGAYLAYVNRDGMLDVIDMRDQRSLLGANEAIGQPTGMTFSPDGRSLALTLIDQNNTWRLLLRDIESGSMRTLLQGSTSLTGPSDPLPLVPSPIAWTPDGLVVEHLLWASDAPPRDIALINPADGSKRVLREEAHVHVYPARASTKIAVVTGALRLGEPPTNGIVVLDTATGDQREIRPVQLGLVRKLSWSPDELRLLYAVSADYQSQETTIHTLNVDGSGEQVIEIGTQGVKAAYADIAWQSEQVALLLSPEADGYAHLYSLPIATFDITGLQPVAAFMRQQPDQPVDEIIFTPN